MHKIHYRIISSVWMIFGVVGVILSAVECIRLLRRGVPLSGGSIVSTLIAYGFCAFAATAAIGLFRARRWAIISARLVAVLFGLYCLSFIAMVNLEFGVVWYAASWFGIAFVAYTLTVIWILSPHDHEA